MIWSCVGDAVRCNSRAELLLAEAETGAGAGRLAPEEGFTQAGEGAVSKPEFRSGENGPGDGDGVDKPGDGGPKVEAGDLTEAASMWAKETGNE